MSDLSVADKLLFLEKNTKLFDILNKDFSPISDARATAKGRMVATKNLLIKFYNDTIHKKNATETQRAQRK
jgi:xanthine dehydrogenase iron-sulfur cluster and FAD-binding subunit A